MTRNVTIVDYGVGNLLSVTRAFESIGASVRTSSNPSEISKADRIVLPGVGAFGHGMQVLSDLNLVDAIRENAVAGRPFLGICLGMQMIFDVSEEFGDHNGLGLMGGRVKKIPTEHPAGRRRIIPHVGWNCIRPSQPDWRGSLLDETEVGEAFYFVHSFQSTPDDPNDRTAICIYDGATVTAVVGNNNVWGVQFHPEKSGQAGLNILRRFLKF